MWSRTGHEGCVLITFERVTKQYLDATVAVDALDFEVPTGKTMVLVGPERLREDHHAAHGQQAGRADRGQDRPGRPGRAAGESGSAAARDRLCDPGDRAFPHRTVEDNIATVPLLNGWRRGKARARARGLMRELLEQAGPP